MMTRTKPTTIPSALTAPTIYLPVIHGGHGKTYFPELHTSDATKAMVVADIANAQHECVRSVIALDLATGKAWDASEDIARDVMNEVLGERGDVPAWCRDFLEEHLGIAVVNMAEREAA